MNLGQLWDGEILRRPGRVWVIDPIDGTAEFVRAESGEFCSVVCLLEDLESVFTLAAIVQTDQAATGVVPLDPAHRRGHTYQQPVAAPSPSR